MFGRLVGGFGKEGCLIVVRNCFEANNLPKINR